MSRKCFQTRNEEGFVLVASLMILLVLTIIGISATRTTVIELMISGNEKVYKNTFYKADGGTELAERLIFENAVCYKIQRGFDDDFVTGVEASIGDNIIVEDLRFSNTNPASVTPSDANRALVYYPTGSIAGGSIVAGAANDAVNPEHTNILVQNLKVQDPGFDTSMVTGYDGPFQGAIGSTSKRFTIDSQHLGMANSESIVQVRWKFKLYIANDSSVFDCQY